MPDSWITVESAGASAPWLTMVHGMAQDSRVFDRQVEDFRDTFRICLIDLPGHGRAADCPGPFGHHEFTGHVLQALDEAGIERTHFWGTHTGASVGLMIAAREPERLNSLVLESPVMPGTTIPVVAFEIARARNLSKAESVADARNVWWQEACWFEVMRANPEICRAERHRQIVDEFPGAPWLDERMPRPVPPVDQALRRLNLPVMVYNGAGEHRDFLAVIEGLKTLIADIRIEVIAGAGGFPAWEYPGRVNPVVRAFLSEAGSS